MNYEKYLPYIDVAEGVARLMNDMRIYTMILKKFDSEAIYRDILTAATARDYTGLQMHAHTMKGTAANLSLKRLQEVSLEIENCAKEGREPGNLTAEMREVLDMTAVAVAQVVASV